MSINRKMETYILQVKNRIRSPSGAPKYSWRPIEDILVAVYKKSENRVVESERYKECTHVGITHYKDVEAFAYRLVNNGEIYEILSCDTEPRLTILLLKEVANV